MLPWSILPDAVEFDEWKTGTRHEGTFYSLVTLAQKVASSVAVPLALLTQFTFYIVGEMMTAVFDAVAASIQASIEAALQAAFTPLLTLGNVLSQTSYRVEITPLFHVFVHLPPAPIVTIKF